MNDLKEARERRFADRLISALIVVGFVGLFMALLNTLSGRSPQEPGDAARHARAVADVKTLGRAVENFTRDKKRFPRTLDELTPQYIKSVPTDPYGNPYKLIQGGHQVWVFYYGKDGRPKGFTPMDVDIAHNVTLADVLSATPTAAEKGAVNGANQNQNTDAKRNPM
jgi:hypothetical protein